MKLEDHYRGGEDPFEGDRTLWLRSLSAGARVTKATVTLKPAAPTGGKRFIESISFDDNTGVGNWGATRSPVALSAATFQAVAELHARRNVVKVVASGEVADRPVTVQVNLGGTWVGLADDGTILTPEKQPLILELPVTQPTPPAATTLPSVTVDKIQLTAINADRNVDRQGKVSLYGLTISSTPTNVSVRLGEKPPFWMYLGELVISQTSPDFAPILNAFLATARVEGGFYAIPFVVHSDAIARLDVDLTIEYVMDQPVLPSFLPEVTLPYGYSSLPGVAEDLLTARLPRGARPVAGTGRAVHGTFDASRVICGQIGESVATAVVTVSSVRILAQPISLDAETPVSAIDLPLANTEPGLAELKLVLQSDADGTPSGEVLVSADVTVERPVPGGSSWGSAALPSEFRFLPKTRYWLVLQILSGNDQAFWEASTGPDQALLASGDGGFSWRTAAEQPLQAVFRLRHTPEHFTVPVQLQIGRGADARRVKFDRFAPLGRVEFDMDFTAELEGYLASPAAASPCGRGELLVNGGFEQPLPDDATRKLFGFDAPRSHGPGGDTSGQASLKGTVNLEAGVDLSVQRYIVLSIDKGRPVRIDCAGAVPERTSKDEILTAINRVMGGQVAKYEEGLKITSPTFGPSSVVELHPWCRRQVPDGWQGQAGRIIRAKQYESLICALVAPPSLPIGLNPICPDGVVSTLDPMEPAELAQDVPVSGGCSYILSLLFARPIESEAWESHPPSIRPQDPSWEVLWLDGKGQLIRRDGEKLEGLYSPGIEDWRLQGRVHLQSPAGAAQATVRFIQPPPGYLILYKVSLIPTLERVLNSSLSLWRMEQIGGQEAPLGWTVKSGVVRPGAEGAVLRGSANGQSLPDDTVLIQITEVMENKDHELQVRARSMVQTGSPAALPDQPPSRLELRWMAGQAAVGAPAILPLEGRDFSAHAWRGTAPSGADHAEIRLIQPKGPVNLLVESVSLRRSDQVSAPLLFLAEAPGELTVSDLRVAYDLPESPGPLSLPRQTATALGRLALDETMVEPASMARSPLSDLDIRAVNGISEYIAAILSGMTTPITTLSQLAALDPETKITDLSRERRLILKAAAETILSLDFQATPFTTMSSQPLETLLALTPAEVAEQASQPLLRSEQLLRHLRSLKLLLKSDAFRKLRLSDLMPQ